MAKLYSVMHTSFGMPVETFFVMGGLLMTISTLNSISKNSLNIPRMILRRFLRYTPLLAAMTLFTVSFYKFFLDGPVSDSNNYTIVNCQNHWLATIFHFQNYFYQGDLCLSHSWYLAVDFQLFIISLFLIYPAFKYGWKCFWVVPALAVASSLYVLQLSITHQVSWQNFHDEHFKMIYYYAHARAGSWLVGMTLGFILHSYNDTNLKISKPLNAFGWIAALSTLIGITLLHKHFTGLENEALFSPAVFMAFKRPIWSIGVGWIIFACHKLKTGGFIKWLLELSIWQPIGKFMSALN